MILLAKKKTGKSNLKKLGSIKALKRTMYKGRAQKFKKQVWVMVLIAFAAALLWFCRYAYLGYAESSANIVLSYPEIALSDFPDRSRFTYYDFISHEHLDAALEIMHAKGLYQNFTADDLRDCFYLYSNLDGSAARSVAELRSSGNDFTFVSNNYKLTFVQPHDYKSDSLMGKILTPDHSDDFLKALIEANRVTIAEKAGGILQRK